MKLPKSDCFHLIPDAELAAAWHWEIEREAGSKEKPWLGLRKDRKATFVDYCEPKPSAMREHDIERATPDFFSLRELAFANTPLQVHVIEIDWSAGKDRLVTEFEEWLRTCPTRKSRQLWPEWRNKGGRKSDVRSWLMDLAIYRAARRGKPQSVKEALLPLVQWSGAGPARLDDSHWADAKRKTVERIEQRKNGPFIASILFR